MDDLSNIGETKQALELCTGRNITAQPCPFSVKSFSAQPSPFYARQSLSPAWPACLVNNSAN